MSDSEDSRATKEKKPDSGSIVELMKPLPPQVPTQPPSLIMRSLMSYF